MHVLRHQPGATAEAPERTAPATRPAGVPEDATAGPAAGGSASAPVSGGPGTPGREQRDLTRLGVAGAALTFAALALLWVLLPLHRPTDEASHLGYAREVSQGRLPTIDTPVLTEGDPVMGQTMSTRDAAHRTIWTANHPPLYYLLAAVPVGIGDAADRPNAGAYAARVLTLLLGVAGLVLLALTVRLLVPWRPQLAVAATGVAALLPGFLDVAAAAYNDTLAFLTATATLAAVVAFLIRGPSWPRLALVAATASSAALTRASGLLVVGVAGLAVLVGTWNERDGSIARRLVRACLWAGAVGVASAAVAGWFYLRNVDLYGDLTGSAYLMERFQREPRGTAGDWLLRSSFWVSQFKRIWGTNFALPLAAASISSRMWMLGLLPLAGLLLAAVRVAARPSRWRWPHHPGRALAIGSTVLLLGLLELSLVQFVTQGGNAHIRYLFPGMVAIGLGVAVGLAALPGGRRGLPAMLLIMALACFNLFIRWRYLGNFGVTRIPPLAVIATPVLAGLALQGYALWRLAPGEEERPGTPPTTEPALMGDSAAEPPVASPATP